MNLSNQFVKLPNILKNEPAEVQALWSLISCYISVPDFQGSLKRLCKSCCKAQSAFAEAWVQIRKKYLKIIKMPYDENKFVTRYELYAAPHQLNGTVYLSAAESRAYAAKYPQNKVYNEGYFIPVPVTLLKDNRLSLKAKGLEIEMQRLIQLSRNGNVVDVSKTELMKRCRLRRSNTDAAWNELKNSGYLIQRRYIDEQTGLFGWGYELLTVPTDKPNVISTEITKKSVDKVIETEKAKDTAVTTEERAAIREAIRANIEYDVLIANAGRHEVQYSAGDIESLERIMLDAVCSPSEYISVGGQNVPTNAVREAIMSVDCEDIITLLDNFNRYTGNIRNVRAYKLTALYNATCNRGMALIG